VESIKEYFKENRYFYIALLLLLMGFIVWCYVSGTGTDNRSDSTMDRIETEAKSAGSAVNDARGEVENAEGSIRRAEDAVESGQRAAEEVSGGINECQELASESRKLNTDIASLIRDIEAANRKRTQDSKKSPVAK
jgi:peptidoglycan hydrolase CwlO-like protein